MAVVYGIVPNHQPVNSIEIPNMMVNLHFTMACPMVFPFSHGFSHMDGPYLQAMAIVSRGHR